MQVTIYDERVFSSYAIPQENIPVEKPPIKEPTPSPKTPINDEIREIYEPPNEKTSNIRQVVTTRINTSTKTRVFPEEEMIPSATNKEKDDEIGPMMKITVMAKGSPEKEVPIDLIDNHRHTLSSSCTDEQGTALLPILDNAKHIKIGEIFITIETGITSIEYDIATREINTNLSKPQPSRLRLATPEQRNMRTKNPAQEITKTMADATTNIQQRRRRNLFSVLFGH
jgi:hypothetical protein